MTKTYQWTNKCLAPWPPKKGDVWRSRRGDLWTATGEPGAVEGSWTFERPYTNPNLAHRLHLTRAQVDNGAIAFVRSGGDA